LTFLDIVDLIEREVRQKYGSKVTQGSLNNCQGKRISNALDN
jgi:hypothetical protein